MPKIKDYPREVMIGESIYQVKFVRKIGETDTRETLGLCDPNEQVIYIKLGQSPRERLKTLCHELIHCFEFEYGFEVPHHLVHKLEEPIVAFLMENCFIQSSK